MAPRDLDIDPQVADILKKIFARELEGTVWRGESSAALIEAIALGYVIRRDRGGVFRKVLSGYELTSAGVQTYIRWRNAMRDEMTK